MKSNKKLISLFAVLIMLLAVNAVCATEDVSDVIAADTVAADSEISLSQDFDENLGDASTLVVTNSTFGNYFTAEGELNDNVSAGSTLDFQGTFTGTDYKVNITKPVNIISSTQDALFDNIGKKDSTGGCFHISAGGSGTNVSDIKLINSAFYVTGASDVIIDNIYMMADMSGVGQSTGFMCVQAGSKYVTVKNSYFENRGTGSSILVIGYSDYCTVDNNEVVINGSSGNAIYITTYVPAKWSGNVPTGNNITNNYIHGQASGFCMALVVAGNENLIEGNKIDYNGGSGIVGQSFSTQYNNTYKNNVQTGGCAFTAGENSIVIGNSVDGTMSAGSNSIVQDNDMKTFTLSKANVVVDSNVIGEGGVTLNAAASNTTLTNNVILSPVTVKSKSNTIQKNVIDAASEYAVDLGTTTGNEVSYNNLSSSTYTGDAAVKAGDNNSVHDNGGLDNIVTKDNFFYFFDTDGNYRNLNFTELYFKGEFDRLVNVITINQTLTILSMNATLKDMAFLLSGDGITLNGLNMETGAAYPLSKGSTIYINGTNATIKDMTVNLAINGSSDAFIIHTENADNLSILDNDFKFSATSNGTDINNVIYVVDSSNVLVDGNKVTAFIPSCAVVWKEIPPASKNWVKFPVSEGLLFDGCSDLTLTNNDILVIYNGVVGEYDTIYMVDIKGGKNVKVSQNNLTGNGHSYIYGLYVEAENLSVDNNNFAITSDNNYANGIEIEASKNATISNNLIDILSPALAYPVYSGMNGGDLVVNYINNTIVATSDVVYGMELAGTEEVVIGNTITVNGNRTTGIAAKAKDLYVANNTIKALGENFGNTSYVETFVPMTAGINLVNSKAIIKSNDIISNSRGIVVDRGYARIEENEINVTDNGKANSYGILAAEAEINVYNNDINYVGNTNGTTINNAVNLEGCKDAVIYSNGFNISIPSCYVDWKEDPATKKWVKFPVSEGLVFNSCNDLKLWNNEINVEATSIVGAYDTIYAIDIKESARADVSRNIIDVSGHSYTYGLYIEAIDSAVDNNNFTITSDNNYANGIEVEASIGMVIKNNDIEVTSPAIAYGIYTGMNGGDLEIKYVNNTINVTSDIVYAMELCGSEEKVFENVITANGNKTTAIAIKSKDAHVAKNEINALGQNLGNSTNVETFKPMTAAINAVDSQITIELNTINSNSKGIIADGGKVGIEFNEITVTDNGLDDSYGISLANTSPYIYQNNITYTGNTNSSFINNAVYIKDCDVPLVNENNFEINIPSCPVKWEEIPPGSGNWVGTLVSEGIVVDSPALTMKDNNITLNHTDAIGSYDTIYALDIKSNKSTIASNNIEAYGHSYIYGLVISGEGFAVENNTIKTESDEFYANGIDVEGPASGIVKGNEIESIATNVTYPVYSAMSNGNVAVDYINNTINSEAEFAYAMELGGLKENVEGNVMNVKGEKAVGIYSLCENVTVKDNKMSVVSNSSDSVAFKGRTGNATITDNDFTVEGKYTVDVTEIDALVKDNKLVANELTGDASVDYEPETSSVYNNTPKMDKYFLEGKDLDKYFGNAKQLEFVLTDASGSPVANKTINITINGKNYTRVTDENGTAKMNINLNSGNYSATATFVDGNNEVTADAAITILSTIESNDITKIFKNGTQYYATFVDSDGNVLNDTNVTFNINGVFYTRKTDGNGTAKLNINLPQGEYIITAYNPKTGEQAANNVTVLPSIVNNTDLVKYYKNESQYYVTILGDDGNPVGANVTVKFNINGVFYERQTNASGVARLNINLEPGNYIITAEYNDCRVSNNITVLPVLNATDLTKKYGTADQFVATLVNGTGAPYPGQNVTFNINGVFYNKVTDEQGNAKLNINLMPGEYIITSSYNGANIANKVTVQS